MHSVHLGSCMGCGRSVFGAPGTIFGGFEPWQANCACLTAWKERAPLTAAMINFGFVCAQLNGNGMPAYDLVCKKIHVLDTDILLFSLRRGEENVVVGHLEI